MNDTKNRELRNTDDGDLEVCRAVANVMRWACEWEDYEQMTFLQEAPEQMTAAVKGDYAANLESARMKWAKARANLKAVVNKREFGPLGSAALLYFINQMWSEDIGLMNRADHEEIWENIGEIIRVMSFTATRALQGEKSAEDDSTPEPEETASLELEGLSVASGNGH